MKRKSIARENLSKIKKKSIKMLSNGPICN